MAKKKMFNPFKSWVAWLGAVLFVILPPIWLIRFPVPFGAGTLALSVFENLFSALMGFLIGLAIHTIIRWLRK